MKKLTIEMDNRTFEVIKNSILIKKMVGGLTITSEGFAAMVISAIEKKEKTLKLIHKDNIKKQGGHINGKKESRKKTRSTR